MNIEEAQRVVAKHRRQERERQVERKKAALVGRYFKTENSYGSDSRWWLYGSVTDVSEWGHASGWTFQRKLDRDHDECELNDGVSLITVETWQEISREEFATAALQFRADIDAKLDGYLGRTAKGAALRGTARPDSGI